MPCINITLPGMFWIEREGHEKRMCTHHWYCSSRTFKFAGEFGDVYKGIMRQDEGKAITIAVKTLKVKNALDTFFTGI